MDSDKLARRVSLMQIIAGAMIAGVVAFTLIAVVMVRGNGGAGLAPPEDRPILTFLAIGLLCVNVPLSLVLPDTILRRTIHAIAAGALTPKWANPEPDTRTPDDRLLAARQTGMIISLALLEGVGFLAGMAYLLEGQLYALGVVVVAVVLMAWHFPTQTGVQNWLERHRAVVRELTGPDDRPPS
jgi:hypothetical protein